MVSREDVKRLSELALIDVADDELDTLAREMDAILEYVSQVNELASDGTKREKPLLYNVMRDDVALNEPGASTDAIVSQFPDRDGNSLRVKKIL